MEEAAAPTVALPDPDRDEVLTRKTVRATPANRGGDGTLRRWLALIIVGFAFLVGTGITTSSLSLLDDPADGWQGHVVGSPRSIRSDEWIRGTPVTIGDVTRGPEYGNQAQLAAPLEDTPGRGAKLTEWLVFPEATIGELVGRVRPESGMAFSWWFSIALFWLALPIWVRQMGLTLRWGIVAAGLVYFTPASAWWTNHPVQLVGWSALAATTALAASGAWAAGRATRTLGWLALSSVAFAHLALSYLVWAIPVAATLLVPTAIALVRRPNVLRGVGIIATCLAGGVLMAGAYVGTHSDYFSALAGTTYPAARSVAGESLSLGFILGGPFLGFNQQDSVEIVNSNLSEIATGYTVLGVVGLLLVLVAVSRGLKPSPSLIAVGSVLVVCATWCLATWPPAATHLFPLSVIPPARMAQILFVPATIFFVLALDLTGSPSVLAAVKRGLPWVALILGCALLYAGSQLRLTFIPSMPIQYVWILSGLWVVGLAALVVSNGRVWGIAPVAALAIMSSVLVNPVQVGFGDLQTSKAALQLQSIARDLPSGAFFASDDLYTNAILSANGINSLSGQQWGGPNRSLYERLDSSPAARDAWNRGASSVVMSWGEPGSQTQVSSPGPDIVAVTVDPCAPTLQEMGLRVVVSSRELLGYECLTASPAIQITGTPRWVYVTS